MEIVLFEYLAENNGLDISLTSPKDVHVTPADEMGAATEFCVTESTSTQFTIHVRQAPGGSGATFARQRIAYLE